MSSAYHEPVSELSAEARDIHRALASLIEEIEAVDWYHQRVDAMPDEDLKAILIHNRDEEIEHAAMALEWLRRRVPRFDEHLRTYLFSSGPIPEIEEKREAAGTRRETDAPGESGEQDDLGIGKFERST